ncbi:MAG: YcxB family protein [Armatimonadetes bacterium]|nr:YcxB family protein [Armatimonadota bacterium]
MDLRPDDSLSVDVTGAERVAFGPGTEGVARLRAHAAGEDAVEVTFSYTEADLTKVLLFYRRHGALRRSRAGLAALFGLGALMAVVSGSIALLTFYVVMGVFLAGYVRLLYRLLAARMLRRDDAWRHERSWTVSEDGVLMVRPDADGRLGWPAIQRVLESPDGFLVFPQANLFHLLPKRCLTDEQTEQVRALAQANCRYERLG